MLIAEQKSLYISLFFQSLQIAAEIAAKLLTNTSKEGGEKNTEGENTETTEDKQGE